MSTRAIERFLQRPEDGGAYTDEKLAMLLAHAQDGKLIWASCCCFVGIPTASHALTTSLVGGGSGHYAQATEITGAYDAEVEFFHLGNDEECRAKLIPLILEEIKRRETLNAPAREYGELAREPSEVFAAS